MGELSTIKKAWEDKFIQLYTKTGNVSLSAKGCGIHRNTVYARREASPDFAKAMDGAREEAIEALEYEAWKRAKSKSDVLLIFLLKSLKPDMYRETTRQEIANERDKDGNIQPILYVEVVSNGNKD